MRRLWLFLLGYFSGYVMAAGLLVYDGWEEGLTLGELAILAVGSLFSWVVVVFNLHIIVKEYLTKKGDVTVIKKGQKEPTIKRS